LDIVPTGEHGICRDSVSFRYDDQIVAYDFPSGNSLALAVAYDQSARARQIAQSLQHAFGAGFLYDGDGHG
jgi:hypothetical protein